MRLELRDLTLRYDSQTALDDASAILEGQILALLGSNGSGKTSLLRILAGVASPSEGQALLDGTEVVQGRHLWISYLPQETGFFPFLQHPGQTLSLSLRLRGVDDPEAPRRLLAAMGLEEEERSPAGYSGGMKQKLRIAQALTHAPRLLLLDEPTTGLDAHERMRVLRLLDRLRDRVAVVFSTHDPEDAAAIADHVLVLHRGRVVATGTPAAVTAMAEGLVSTIIVTTPLIPHFAGCAVVHAAREGERLDLRVVGEPPPGAAPVPPRLEDAYALLTRNRT
jgi:ABC-type multidrug transport system ATPase subunit